MIISKQNDIQDKSIIVDNVALKRVDKLMYLGSNINKKQDPDWR